jgi:glycosyltransferase involved in cell wall biosynthesis
VTRPLRILVAQNVPNNRRSGMSRMLGFLHDRVERDGHAVEYFGSEQVPARLGGRWARLAFPWLVWRHAAAAARAGRPYDVVNVHEPAAAVVALRRRSAGNPFVVVTSHGVEDRGWAVVREDARLGRAPLSVKTRLWYPALVLTQARVGFRRADHVFCLNEEDRAFLRRKYRLPADRVTRMFPAADPPYAAVFPRRDYAAADRLLFFGTWLPRKGNIDFVAAFAALAARHPALRATVIGAGLPAEAVVGSFPESLRGRVEYVPPGPAEGYAETMLGAAVYILPSVFEGTPLTLMESMATGLPPVATATCGMRDVIRDGENGLLVPVRDPAALAAAVGRLLADPPLRERLGRRANADVIEKYTWDRVAGPVRAVYRRLAERRSGKAGGEP